MYSLFAFPMLHVSLSHPPLASFIIKPKSLGFPRRKGAPVTRSFELPSFLQLSQLWSILLKSVRGLLLCFGASLKIQAPAELCADGVSGRTPLALSAESSLCLGAFTRQPIIPAR